MTIRIATLNCNGLRACVRNGFWEWFNTCEPSVLCLQEVRFSKDSLDKKHSPPDGWHFVQVDAQKKGYSGVAIWSRFKPLSVSTSIGLPWADDEGRAVCMHFKEVDIWSIYFPSGTSGSHRQELKDQFLTFMSQKMSNWINKGRKVLVCGDVNIAHTRLDIFHDKSNAKNSGFLPHERQWMSDQISSGWVDIYRKHHPDAETYSWWSNRSKTARPNNIGWRIDYQLSTPSLALLSSKSWVDGPQPKISDHAPVIAEFDLKV
jgi:exodeoxyribonuclease III